jgi:hypothetical protein
MKREGKTTFRILPIYGVEVALDSTENANSTHPKSL